MRRLSRFAPILVGLVLGYLLMSPPEWLAPLGPWRWPAIAAIVLLGLLAFTAWARSFRERASSRCSSVTVRACSTCAAGGSQPRR